MTQKNLGLVVQSQQQENWCWCATTTSIALFYAPASGWTQCAVANTVLGLTTCCQDGASNECNRPGDPGQALIAAGHLDSSAGPLVFSQIAADIDAARPLSLGIDWYGGGGAHNLVVDGYDDADPANPTIDIQDPKLGHTVQDFNSFPGTYQGGALWTSSWGTQ